MEAGTPPHLARDSSHEPNRDDASNEEVAIDPDDFRRILREHLDSIQDHGLSHLERARPSLCSILNDWPCDTHVAYALDSFYQEDEIMQENLLGRDGRVVAELEEACKRMEFHMFLANVHRVVRGPGVRNQLHDEGGELRGVAGLKMSYRVEDETNLTALVNLDGTEPLENFEGPMQDLDLLQTDIFDDDNCDDVEYHEGSEINITYSYDKSFAVIVPKSAKIAFLVDHSRNPNETIFKLLTGIFDKNPVNFDGSLATEYLEAVCMVALRESTWTYPEGGLSDDTIAIVLHAACNMDDLYIVECCLPLAFSNSSRYARLEPCLEKQGRIWLDDILDIHIRSIPTFDHRMQFIDRVALMLNDVQWKHRCFIRAVNSLPLCSQEDGQQLALLAPRWVASKDFDTFFVSPVRRFAQYPLMVKEFLVGTQRILRSDTFEAIVLSCVASSDIRPSTTMSDGHFEAIAEVLRFCHGFGGSSSIAKFVSRSCRHAIQCSLADLQIIYIKFLTVFATRLQDDELAYPYFQSLFRNILNLFVAKTATPKPKATANTVRFSRGCGNITCLPCRHLDNFLRSPTATIINLPCSKEERKHINSRIRVKPGSSKLYIPGLLVTKTRSGLSCILKITKTNEAFDEVMKAWRAKTAAIKGTIANVGMTPLIKILGSEDYRTLMKLERISNTRLIPPTIDLTEDVQSTNPTIAGERFVETISVNLSETPSHDKVNDNEFLEQP